ncbi:hypothetical protein, variant 2 [Aphanomyces invadans]|uniref:Uncharacterized protein n=1 Tax=Aphanomyces invadans TaxID=157072 RepID=A0A024UG84_9STRA|nr:hypothetical protein, variant 2 [Aphanomyces invadans]ETW05220.1 hypothetical protein, variant 2 [Aphanomyces invadans]|eukprot:XP_008866661.1 hypothetical protein, variant 2 [Aphanomyces invadans]
MDDEIEGTPLSLLPHRDDVSSNSDSMHTLEVRVFELVTELVPDAYDPYGQEDQRPNEQTTIRNMNWLSETLEQAEAVFRHFPAPRRDGQLIGHLLRILDDFEDFYSMLERKLQAESAERANNDEMNAAVCRLLLATAPTNARFIIRLLYDEDILDRITRWANTDDASTMHRVRLRCYACGLLSVALRDRSVADLVVNHDTFCVNLLKRARFFASALEREHNAAAEYMLEVQRRSISSKHKKQTNSGAIVSSTKKRKLSMDDKKEPPSASQPGKAPSNTSTTTNSDAASLAPQLDTEAPKDDETIAARLADLIDVPIEDTPRPNHDQGLLEIALLDLLYAVECIGLMGEYLELLASALKDDIVGTSITLLHTTHTSVWSATLKLISHFLAHKKFAFSFLDAGGLELVLSAHATPLRFALLHRSLSMCLHGFASSSVVTEIILTRESTRSPLLAMAMALLSSPHDRARQNAVVFYGLVVPFRSALEYFETHDGLYTLFNLIRAGNTPKTAVQRQLAHDACLCLRQYVRVHFGMLAQGLRRKMDSTGSRSSQPKQSAGKPVDIDDKAHEQHLALFELHRPPPKDLKWQTQFSHLRGPLVLLEVLDVFHAHSVATDPSSEPTSYRLWLVERALFSLQILRVLTLAYPPMALEICQTALQDSQRAGLTILLDCAMTGHPRDGDIVKGAIQVFCNCVLDHKPPPKAKDDRATVHPSLRSILKLAREKNAIKVCLQLLRYKRSLQQADAIRLLATQALLGLSKDRHVTQILEQMQIGQLLSDLIRAEPVLEENADVQAKFRVCALDLISHVTHRAPSATIHEATDPTVRKIEKANIVAATRITYNPTELLVMIHEHLKANGLHHAADALEREAALKLPASCPSPQKISKKAKSIHADADQPPSKKAKVHAAPKLLSFTQRRQQILNSWKHKPSYFDAVEAATTTHLNAVLSPKRSTCVSKKVAPKPTWLDTVVRQHLREQHRLCPHPVSVVPPFSLTSSKSHRCPDVSVPPLYANVCSRLSTRGAVGHGPDMNFNRFVSSRHRPFQIMGHPHGQAQGGLTAARFMTSRHILLGTDHGEVLQMHLDHDEIVGYWNCHANAGALTDISTNEHTRARTLHPLLLTGTTRMANYVQSKVGLWNLGSMDEARWTLSSVRSPRFNHGGDRIVALACHDGDSLESDVVRGTAIYDVETGTLLSHLADASRGEPGHTYGDSSNCSFSPCDATVLSDGLLWDVRSSALLHKFDKLSNFGYGFYNPSGNEVIINSAVWDLRTFKLLRVVPALESSKIQFCSSRPMMYVYSPFEPLAPAEPSKKAAKNRTWLRVMDTRDYKDVSTVDIERPIYDVCLNAQETALGIVEGRYLDSVYGQDDPVCRLYEIGRDKPNECDSDLENTLDDGESESMDEEEFGESASSGSDDFSSSGSAGDDSEDDFDTDTDFDAMDDEADAGHLVVQWANLYDNEDEGGDDAE